MNYIIRPYNPETDNIEALTELLHRAYAPLKEQGMWFLASVQDARATRIRLEDGLPFVAVDTATNTPVGTITVYAPALHHACEWYRETCWHFGQFAVEPGLQGQGIGAALVNWAEQTARSKGATAMALDTAEPATGLVTFYKRLGYQQVGHMQWGSVNYRSVVLKKSLLQ